MVKHKNSISNGHFRKHWQKYVKTDFDKPLNKIKRRNKRKSKLTNINRYNFCPKNILRPVITNQTKMYNLKVRLGGGFSNNEINKSNVSHKIASSIGISVDKRRRRDNLKQSFNIMITT
jgi:large subunit ribosomal protein L13e